MGKGCKGDHANVGKLYDKISSVTGKLSMLVYIRRVNSVVRNGLVMCFIELIFLQKNEGVQCMVLTGIQRKYLRQCVSNLYKRVIGTRTYPVISNQIWLDTRLPKVMCS